MMSARTSWWSHISAALSSTIVSQALAAVAQVIIIRALGSSGYGTYTTLYAWLAIAGSVIGAGFDIWMLDRGSRHPDQIRQYIRLILRIKIGLWLIVFAVFLWQIDRIAITLLGLGFVVILLESISATILQALRALNRHHTVAVLQLIAPSVLLGVVIWWEPSDIHWLLVIQLISLSIVLISAQHQLTAHVPDATVPSTPTSTLITSWPFIISDVLAQIYTYTSTLLLASYASAADVGIFRGAWSFIAYTVVVPSIIFSTTLPLLNNTNRAQRLPIIWRSAMAFGMYALAVSAFVASGGGQVIVWLYGESFAPSVAFIAHLTILPLIKAVTFFGVMLIIHRQRLAWRIIVQLITVSVLWLVMPPLIGQFGISGAIQAQLMTESILAIGYLIGGIWPPRQASTANWPPQRIVITNMYGTRNLGDAAIHQVQLAWLTHQFSTATIQRCYAVAPDPYTIQGISHWVYDQHGHIAPWPTRLRRMSALIWSISMHTLGITTTWGMTATERRTFVSITTADLVCASGGGYLFNMPSNRPWWRLFSWDIWQCADLLVAVIWHRPVVLLPQSIGPLYSWPFRALICWILRRAHVVYVRESLSAHLLDLLAVPHQRAPDMVWGLPVPAHHQVPNTPTLGITLMDWGSQSGQPAQQQTYESAIITVARHFHTRGWRIQLFAQCTDQAPGWDDTLVVQRLATHLPFATVMPTVESPTDLQHQYAQLTCLLSTRLHGALIRFAMGQSAVVIAYHPKAYGIMHDNGLGTWCLPIDTITSEAIIMAIDTHSNQLPIIATQRQQCIAHLAQLTIPTPND
jgi:polysaccharide pyruvyl transferase WcaK-like protein/O-antigen/teichoic acid export membrane protein